MAATVQSDRMEQVDLSALECLVPLLSDGPIDIDVGTTAVVSCC